MATQSRIGFLTGKVSKDIHASQKYSEEISCPKLQSLALKSTFIQIEDKKIKFTNRVLAQINELLTVQSLLG